MTVFEHPAEQVYCIKFSNGWHYAHTDQSADDARASGLEIVEYVPAEQLQGAVARADAAEGRISLAERRLQFAFQRAGIEVDAQWLEGFVKHAAQHIERGR